MKCGLSVRNTCCTNTQRKKTTRFPHQNVPTESWWNPPSSTTYIKILQRLNLFQVLTPQSVDTQINLMVTLLSLDWLTKNLNNWSMLTFWSWHSGNRRQDPSGPNKLRSKQKSPHPLVGKKKQGNTLLPPLDEMGIPDPHGLSSSKLRNISRNLNLKCYNVAHETNCKND